jgi:hypothetical protein
MLTQDHVLGWDGDMTIGPPHAPTDALMRVEVEDGYEALSRADVERLRDLCEEALT